MSTRTASQSRQTELSTRNWPISGWLSIPKSLVMPPHASSSGLVASKSAEDAAIVGRFPQGWPLKLD